MKLKIDKYKYVHLDLDEENALVTVEEILLALAGHLQDDSVMEFLDYSDFYSAKDLCDMAEFLRRLYERFEYTTIRNKSQNKGVL